MFAQTLPITEILFLDDASLDDSAAVALAIANDWQRQITVHAETVRSGSAFGLWRKAVDLPAAIGFGSRSRTIAAEPDLLAKLSAAAARDPDTVLAVCDSRAIDENGRTLWPDHQAYYAEGHAADLADSRTIPARAFARSYLAERK